MGKLDLVEVAFDELTLRGTATATSRKEQRVTYESSRRACVRCHSELRVVKNGFQVVHEKIVYDTDLWECPECLRQVVSGFAQFGQPIEEAPPHPVHYPRMELFGYKLPDRPEDRMVCKLCETLMEVQARIYAVLEMAEFGPYKLWTNCKMLVCPRCRYGVVKPYSYRTFATSHHWQKDFESKVARAKKLHELIEVR